MKKPLGFPLILMMIVVFGMTSCVTQKQVKYLQKRQEMDTTSTYTQPRGPGYKIQPNDNLYIKVFSMDEKTYFFFNREAAGTSFSSDNNSDISLYLNGYTVNEAGEIDFPLVGKLYVKDMTTEEVKNLVESKVKVYLKETSVIVKMVSFNVTILGEVKMPGERKMYQDKVTIFEALSIAGDMTDFADRAHVALIRKTPDGSKVVYLDLNSSSILVSPYYQLMPNDIIYVAPLGIKRWGSETFPWALLFASITTALLLLNYFK